MHTQPRALQHEDPVPAKWKTRWYRTRERFLRFLSRILRMPTPLEVEQALQSQQWKSLKFGKKEGLGRCQDHPNDPPMLRLERGNYRCPTCWEANYFRTIDAGPVTDPKLQPLQITDAMALIQRHPSLALRKLQHPTGGTTTQEFRAVHWPKAPQEGKNS